MLVAKDSFQTLESLGIWEIFDYWKFGQQDDNMNQCCDAGFFVGSTTSVVEWRRSLATLDPGLEEARDGGAERK